MDDKQQKEIEAIRKLGEKAKTDAIAKDHLGKMKDHLRQQEETTTSNEPKSKEN